MYRYLIIESKQHKQIDDDVISLFSDLIIPSDLYRDGYQAVLLFEHDPDLSFEDVILNVMSDTLSDLRVYVSHHLPSREERDQHIEITKTYLKQIPFEKYYFLDHKIIVKHFMHQMNDLMKRHFLGKFYHDTLMMETLRVYLDSNLNMVNAAKKLYIHRNTLIQRIDKFYQLTGFDVRLFIDALLVYHLIQ